MYNRENKLVEKREVNKWNNECSPFPPLCFPSPSPSPSSPSASRSAAAAGAVHRRPHPGSSVRCGARESTWGSVWTSVWTCALNLGRVLARYHVQLALAGDTDEYGWEHIDVGVDGGDYDDDDDDDDEMKLAEI